MKLKDILGLLELIDVNGGVESDFTGIAFDSRMVEEGDIFFALPGSRSTGCAFVDEAVDRGAVAVISEDELHPLPVPTLLVSNIRKGMGMVAHHFYGNPSLSMTCTGITGTNGKTTTSYLVDAILGGRYGKTAVMGTLGGVWGGECRQFGLTTPESPVIAREMASMKHDGCRALTMEASSHGLALGRLAGIEFDLAIFTNLSRDHLDFHRDMEHYLEAKLSLFKELGRQSKEGVGIVNLDDPRAKSFLDVSDAKVLTYAIGRDEADVSATDLRLHPDGTDVTVRSHIGDTRLHLRLLGRFNVSNALAGFAAGLALNMGEREIVTGLESVEGVRGRMQMIEVRGIRVVIDYAHTPEALEKLLETLREVFSGRLVTVVGCGGDRDREKRPMMGEVAARLSRDLVITSDNPRSEDPEAILDDLEEGIRLVRDDFKRLTSREEAIQFALDMAESGDIVVIAGKGHEDYQIVAGKRYHFDDLEVARRFLGCGGGQKNTPGGVV